MAMKIRTVIIRVPKMMMRIKTMKMIIMMATLPAMSGDFFIHL